MFVLSILGFSGIAVWWFRLENRNAPSLVPLRTSYYDGQNPIEAEQTMTQSLRLFFTQYRLDIHHWLALLPAVILMLIFLAVPDADRLLVLLALLGAGGAFAFTQLGESDSGVVASADGAAPVLAIQGEVEEIDGRRLTIYGMQVDIPSDAAVLETLRPGDVVYVEGAHTSMGRIMTITRLNDAFIVGEDEDEE